MILAAIDIGSNAARLLINEIKTGKKGQPEFIKLNLVRIPLRLGIDVFSHGEILNNREIMIINTMKIFADIMNLYQVENYRACATSAMRDAKNGNEIIEIIKETSGIQIEIISGDEEAELIFDQQLINSLGQEYNYLYIDVGGGSTEISYFQENNMVYKKSFNIGTIRMLNNLVTNEQWKELKTEIKENIKTEKPIIAIGSGGNINKTYSLSKTKDGKPLSITTIKKFQKELKQLSIEERMNQYKIREDRADVLVPALEIYTKIMSLAGINKIYVPKISVADGLIKKMYHTITKEKQNQTT